MWACVFSKKCLFFCGSWVLFINSLSPALDKFQKSLNLAQILVLTVMQQQQ